MNPNQPYQQQPQPGMPPYNGTAGQGQPVPAYATDPQAILQASGAAPAPAPVPMPQPPAPTNAGAAPQPVYQAQQGLPAQPYTPARAQGVPATNYSQQQPLATSQSAAAVVGQGAGLEGNQGIPGVKPTLNNPNSTQNMLQ